ncbi:ATP phosphoribosyltransferase [Tichowtungia aerotolerans]|uniref:ATP phosphoribosyltransferase n=1 Tax=Tichowtungia aerotolerans TaxID=2697043 RepID=A0A6P1M794_9BACT|nr:ATP phosphoribosyltransferase [Tichowtungia aerotolerans]QHI69902.1 ATP phosphoribosyltransferase [Tichowtungia aerotolerans]
MNKLIIGLPKGSLQESTYALFAKAGFHIKGNSRSYFPSIDDDEIELRLLRSQEMSRYVEAGMLDAGISGLDWIAANGSDVHVLCDMVYSKQTKRPVRWVLAVPEDSPIQSVKDLEGKRIATEGVALVERWLAENGVKADVEFSWGATEVKVPEFVDAIVDITETGSSLRAHNLRIVDTLMESYTQFFCSQDAWTDDWKHAKLEKISLLLQAALNAADKVLLKMNVSEGNLDAVKAQLPALHSPTVSGLSDDGWYAIETVVEESVVREIIPELKAAGAEGIIEIGLNKVVA